MAQLIETKPEVYDRIMDEWGETDPALIGVLLNVISTKKSKQMLKLSKTSPTAEFFIRKKDTLTLVVYETAWERLTPLQQTLLLKGVFSLVSYDTDKEKLNLDTRPYQDLFNMRHTKDANGNELLDKYDEALEVASMVIESLDREKKREKEEQMEAKRIAKEAKKAAKANKF